MLELKDRLIEAMASKDVSRYKLAKDCGLSPSTVTNWILGKTVPDRTKIELVSKYLEVNSEWMLDGKGYKSEEQRISFEEEKERYKVYEIERIYKAIGDEDVELISSISGITPELVKKSIDDLEAGNARSQLEEKEWTEVMKKMKEAAELAKIAKQSRPRIAGNLKIGTLANVIEGQVDQCEQVLRINILPDYDFSFIIKGDGMKPKYEVGDEVFCKRISNLSFIQWGKIHVLDTTQGIIIKRIYEDGDKIRCVSYNPEYLDFSIPKNEIYSISLVVGMLRL